MAIFEWAPLMNGNIWKWCWMWYSETSAPSPEGAKCSIRPGKRWLESKIELALQDVRGSFQLDAEIRPPRSLLGGTPMRWTSSTKTHKGPRWQANPTLASVNKGSREGREGVGEDDGGADTTGMLLWNGYSKRGWGGKCGARGEGSLPLVAPVTLPQGPCPVLADVLAAALSLFSSGLRPRTQQGHLNLPLPCLLFLSPSAGPPVCWPSVV